MAFPCPHCGKVSYTRTSRTLSEVSAEIYYQCSNVFCGHTFKSVEEIVATISPSAQPNPRVILPISARCQEPPEQFDLQLSS